MVGSLLLRGLLVGLVAGLLAFAFAKAVGEPQIDRAIGFEAQLDQAKGTAPEPELVGRTTQAGIGLFTGLLVYSMALGGLFALVFASLYGRFGEFGPRAMAALLALAGFVAVVLVPDLKYPANPPAVGDPETIRLRTALFFAMLAISVGAVAAAAALARRLSARYGVWNAALFAGAAFILAIAVAQYFLPDVNEVPAEFPAVVLWRFRVASLGLHAVLWTTIGLSFGALAEQRFYRAWNTLYSAAARGASPR